MQRIYESSDHRVGLPLNIASIPIGVRFGFGCELLYFFCYFFLQFLKLLFPLNVTESSSLRYSVFVHFDAEIYHLGAKPRNFVE
jgi:hypothetical protein